MTPKSIAMVIVFFCLSATPGLAQVRPFDYAAKWKTVDSLVTRGGLIQSALTEVNALYARARRDDNEAQVIRALLCRIQLESGVREEDINSQAKSLDSEIVSARQPARSILQNLLATTYLNYFQQRRWKVNGRTKTVNFHKADITTWGADDFYKTINELFLSSLREEKLLQQTRPELYGPIFSKQATREPHSTLFDLLARTALDYFKATEPYTGRPANAFEMDDPAVFADAAVFAAHVFTSADSGSLHTKALSLFRRLIGAHLSDRQPQTLLDLDIERILFAHAYAVMEEKDSLYLRALARLTDRYGDEPAAAQAWYLQAAFYAARAGRYDPIEDTAHRYDYLPAKAICEKVLTEKDSSVGKVNCAQLLQQIRRVELTVQTEKVNIPGQPFRSMLTWRNFSRLYGRLIRLDSSSHLPVFQAADEKYWEDLVRLPVLNSFSRTLPETGDYQTHRTEIKMDPLPAGAYALLVSDDKDFSVGSKTLAVQFFFVSSISYINYDQDYFVLNRESGQPLAGATIQVWIREYNNKTYGYDLTRAASYQADQQGHFFLPQRTYRTNAQRVLEISFRGDHLFDPDQGIAYYFPQTEKTDASPHTWLFTDRSIYRPGQTVYFKGIAELRDPRSRQGAQTFSGFRTTVSLYNANNEKVDSLSLTTNDFGSYQGKFTLPAGQLNGIFFLKDETTFATQHFSVEEYRRPKFFVEYKRLKDSYRVGDTIRITGDARAFAGNSIDGATVKYRVTRHARYPYPWVYGRRRPSFGSSQEIAHGEGKTDAEGKFIIPFTALPDHSVNRQLAPIFEYQVSADVTDINGETHSGATTVQAGYQSLELSISLPAGKTSSAGNGSSAGYGSSTGAGLPGGSSSGGGGSSAGYRLPADSLRRLIIRATNLSGQLQSSTVSIECYALSTPQRLIRARDWQEPDQFLLSESEYIAAFPHDEYRDETHKESWPKGNKVFGTTATTDTTTSTTVSLTDTRFTPGWYLVEARTRDKYGQEVQARQYVELYDGKTGLPVIPQYNWWPDYTTTVEPGDKALVPMGSSADSLFVIRRLDRDSADGERFRADAGDNRLNPRRSGAVPGTFSFFTLDKEKKTAEFPIAETDRGGFRVADVFVKDNRLYTRNANVNVPWTNKELRISYLTYRDKTLPGSAQTWQVKISGYKGQKVAAEVLTAMYDASLDQFDIHNWSIPPLYTPIPRYDSWNASYDFYAVSSRTKYNRQLLAYGYAHDENPDIRVSTFGTTTRGAMPQGVMARRDLKSGEDLGDPAPFRGNEMIRINGLRAPNTGLAPLYIVDGIPMPASQALQINPSGIESINILTSTAAIDQYGAQAAGGVVIITTKAGKGKMYQQPEVSIRKNFSETAFFFPDGRTDSAGNTSFSFTMPEALTRWKWMTLAHTKDLSFGYAERTVITQQQLMVQPNMPRFLREGDRLELSAKIVNMTDSELTGQMELTLTDPTTGQTADGMYSNRQPNQFFTVGARQSVSVGFPIEVPYQYNRPLTYRIIARAALPHSGSNPAPSAAGAQASSPTQPSAGPQSSAATQPAEEFSDGEEGILPVVSNRMLVTESLPLNMPGDGARSFRFDKLLNSAGSETLNHHALTVEFSSNPAWYAVQALPYLMEYPYECAEQTFDRFYANALAAHIVAASPRIKEIFDRWATSDTAALLSNLEKNPELRSVLLEETPWVLQGKSESQQKKNIALLFDMSRMSRELESSLDKLQAMQSPNGGFVWFKGGPDDRYITQYILAGIGHLQKLEAIPASDLAKIRQIVSAALPYLDNKIREDYEEVKKLNDGNSGSTASGKSRTGGNARSSGKTPAGGNTRSSSKGPAGAPIRWIEPLPVQYLYMRSFFSDYGIPGEAFAAVNYFRKQVQQHWLEMNKYMQGMTALALFRTGDLQTAKNILASLQQTAIRDEEKGMYWKGMEGGYYWYQAPIETQSLLIEAFREIGANANPAIDRDLRTWLLRQKQTHSWPTTRATADACYALLLGGADWLTTERTVEIRLGDKTVTSTPAAAVSAKNSIPTEAGTNNPTSTEAGTGYFKQVFDGAFVTPSMGNITVTMSSTPTAGQPGPTASPAGKSTGQRPTYAHTGNHSSDHDGTAASSSGQRPPSAASPAWGAVYWQYFDDLDRITPPGGSKSALRLTKQLFIEKNTDRGPVLVPVPGNGTLKVGDKVKVRIELQVDRDMEYVHMKDMRAACMEPVNVLSRYQWQDGVGYYESTKDAGTDFFFARLGRGTYVFEYPLFVSQAGNFSNGVTNVECMYAPEFSYHSEGIRVNAETREP